MKIVSLFAGAGGLDLGLRELDLILCGQMNMIKIFGKRMKRIIAIQY